ncbi:MAG: hypothetical protein Q9224_005198 [Gallowayella concinna]
MPDLGIEARLNFLESSARLLRDTAPSTSAHLMLERNIVADEHDRKLNKSQLKDICRACGTISVPGLTSKTEVTEILDTSKQKQRGLLNEDAKALEIHKCLACYRVITTPLPKVLQNDYQNVGKRVGLIERSKIVEAASKSNVMESEKSNPANASSKRRAKARKQGGLQAMLEKSKGASSQPPGMGLGLMDLVKAT